MYRSAFRKHRALVPVDGFYEWQHNEHRGKQPYYFTRADCQLAVFAGLWEYWERAGQSLWTCTIITTDANPDMESIHNRMPVVLEKADWSAWLDPTTTPEQAHELLA